MNRDKIMSSVKVAVRVRPLSQKEIERNSKFIVDINGDCISVTNIKVDGQADYGDSRERVKHFTFDFCYDSASDPQSPAYSSQELVFQDLGTEILQAAFEGYNACVLAYGQTSTGKTYTMMGNQDEVGLIPRICEGLFSHVDDVMEDSLSFQVKISYLEIYNERVRDLLRPALLKANEKYTLKVREHPKDGPYVQDLSSHYVNDNAQIQSILERGNEYRTTASTYMHDHSSRSHAIVTIEFTQARIEDDLPHEIVSKIHLVDLAGSERADPSYGSHYKGRLREGANINKSLVTLGNVIKALAEKSILSWSMDNLGSNGSCHSSTGTDIGAASPQTGSPKKQRLPYIPYRDSVLTWLLRDSLGGNSKTVMISTVSPASIYYNETISTLRYAQRAKSIINKPKINEDPNVTLIRELRREIERLREMLLSARVADSRTSLNEIVFLLPPFAQKLHENEAEIKQGDNSLCSQGTTDSMLAEKLQENETMADQLTQTWIDKWKEAHELIRDSDLSITGLKRKASSMGVLIESQQPHLVGMDDDILSTGVTIYYLKDGKTLLGREDASREQDIMLKGPGIQREHCFIKNHLGTVTLHPNRNAQCAVNGIDFKGPTKLKQGDYILLGKTNMFRYNNPAEAAKLRIRRQSSVEEMASQDDTERTHPDSHKAELLRPIHPIYAHFASDEICHQLDKQFDNDLQRMEEAKQELQRLQDDHRRAEEARQSKEEELWRTHDQKRAEIEEQRRTLAEIAEENNIQRQRVEEEIAYARECLEEEKEAFQKYLQEELTKLRTPAAHSEQSTRSDLQSLSQLSEEAREVLQKKFSLEGRLKELAQGELLKRLSYLDSEQKLIQEAEDIEDQFTITQEQLQSDLDRLKEVERNHRHSDVLQLKDINTRDEAIEELERKEQQLQGYIQEKQGLLHVGNHTPRHLRTACSEEVLTNIEGTDADFPLRCSSLLSLSRGSEGDLPALSKRMSMASSLNMKSVDSILVGGSVENISMEIGSTASTSLHGSSSSINSESSAKSGKKALKTEQKQGKLTTTAKSVTDRLYKAPPPKFKHEPKEKKISTNTGARIKRDTDRSKRGNSVEKDKTTRERTPTIKKPEQKTVESKGVVLRKSPGRQVVSPMLQKQVLPAPQRQTNGKGAISKEPRLRQSVSQPSLSTDHRYTGNKVPTQRLTLPNKIHKIASASSLACVPEAVGEEGEITDQSKYSLQSVVRRRKRHQFDEDDTRRHSAPIGESLSDAFDKYKQDMVCKSSREVPGIKFDEYLSPALDNKPVWQEGDMETSSDTHNIPTTFTSIHNNQSQEKLSMHDRTFQSELNADDCSPENGDTCINIGKNVNKDTNKITQEMECSPSVMADTITAVECSENLSSAGPQSTLPAGNILNESLVDKTDNKPEGQIEGIHFKNDLNTCIEVICRQGSIPVPTVTDVVLRSDSDTSPQESVHRSIELDSDSGFYPESSDNFESSGALSFASALASRFSVSSEQDLHSPVRTDYQSNVMEVMQSDNSTTVCSGKPVEEKSHPAVDGPPLRPTSFKEDIVVFSETDIDSSSIASPGDVNFFLPESSDSGSEVLKPGHKRELDSKIEGSVPPPKCRKEEGMESTPVSCLDSFRGESAKSSLNQNINTTDDVYTATSNHEEEFVVAVPVSQTGNIAQSSDREDESVCDIALTLAHSKHREDDGNYSSDSLEEDIDSLDGSKPHPCPEISFSDEESLNDSLENSDNDQPGIKSKYGQKEVRDELMNVNSKKEEQAAMQIDGIALLEQKPNVIMNVKPSLTCDFSGENSALVSAAGHFGQISSQVDFKMADDSCDAENNQLVDNSVMERNHVCRNLAFSDGDIVVTQVSGDNTTVEIGKDGDSALSINKTPESTSSMNTEQVSGQIDLVKALSNSTENEATSSLDSTSPNVYSFCTGQNSQLSDSPVHVLPVDDEKSDHTDKLTPARETLIVNTQEVNPEKAIFTNDTSDLNIQSDHQLEQEMLVCGNLKLGSENKDLCSTEGGVTVLDHSIGANKDSGPSTRTLGVSTSPDFLTAEDGDILIQEGEDKDSQCSHDSIRELQEQLQELEDLPGALKGAVLNNQNNNTQLSSARKAARHRAMIRQNHRGTDIESDDINQCSDDSQGNVNKPSSRPTSASRRRKRTQVKFSDKTLKQLKGLSSEECLTSESDGVHSEDSLTNKEACDSVEEELLANGLASGYSREQLDSAQDEDRDKCEVCADDLLDHNNDSSREREFHGSGIDKCEQLSAFDGINLTSSEENLLIMDQLRVNGCVNLSNGDVASDTDEICKMQKNKPLNYSTENIEGSYLVQRSSSRSPSETRDMEQQTDVSWVEGTQIFPSETQRADPTLTVSPVSVWTSGVKGLAVYGPQRPQSRTSSTENSPVKRRKKVKTVKLEITSPDIWSTEHFDLSSTKTTIATQSDDSDEDDSTYIMETEVYSPQTPLSSDKFFADASSKSKPIKYHVTVNEESTNITYNIDRTEYRTYGLRSQIQNPDTVRIPETININLTESSTEVIDSRLESVRTEYVNFHNSDLDSLDSSNSVVAERRYQAIQDASREENDALEKHFEEEMSACYLEHRPNTSTPHPLTVSVNSEDMDKPESMLSPRESDTTSDYGTMIMDSKRGYMSFTLDSGDEGESVIEDNPSPAERVFPPTYDITRSSQGVVNVPAWLQVGTETFPVPEENAVESVLPKGQQLCMSQNSRKMHTIPSSTTVPGEVEYMSNLISEDCASEKRNSSLSSDEEEIITEETIIVARPFRLEALSGSADVSDVQTPVSTIMPSSQTPEDKNMSSDELNNINDESSDSSYRTPQQSPRTMEKEYEENENVIIPDEASSDAGTVTNILLELNLEQKSTTPLTKCVKLKSASVNTDKQQTSHGTLGRTVDDISVREELKQELQQKLAKLQRHVRSFSDSAISSDYTDGDSTSVSPRGSRLYESDKTLRAGIFMEQMSRRTTEDIDVMTTQSDMQFNPSNGESFLSAVSKIVDIDNKEPKKSPLKDSGNVFDDDNVEQVEEIIEPVANDRNISFPSIVVDRGETLQSEQAEENGYIKSNSSNSLVQDESLESSLDKSADGINYHDESREYGSDLDYSDVLYTDGTSDSRSFSPGEIYLDESTPEKMFRSLTVDEPSQESPHEEFETEVDNPSEYSSERKMSKKASHRLHPSNREKSPSMSDIQTIVEKLDDVRRSYSENNIDEFEEEDTNSESSNDSIVFVFMGQTRSKDSLEKLNSEGIGKKQDSRINSELLEKDGSSLYNANTSCNNNTFSEGNVFRPIEHPSHNNIIEYGQFEPHSNHNMAVVDGQELHHGISCESPLRHRFGIDESVLPIPEKSVSSDNLQKLATSKQIVHQSRSASLLDVGVTDNPNDPSNNEGIFPPCVEDYESSVGSREAHGIDGDRRMQDLQESVTTQYATDSMHLKKLVSTEPGNYDFEKQEIAGAVSSQELLYSSLPLYNSSHREGSNDQIDYNGNLPTKEQIIIKPQHLNTLSNESSLRFISPDVQTSLLDCETQTEDANDEATVEVGTDIPLVQQHILPALAAPYRARSADDLGQSEALTSMNFTEETDNWQNTSTVVIETNALLSKINDDGLPIASNSSLDEPLKSAEEIQNFSKQNSKITQTGGSLSNLHDLEIQTDANFEFSLNQSTDSASTQTDYSITKPRGHSETETNDYMPLTVVMQFNNSSTQTEEDDGQMVHSSNSSIQSDTFNNVISRLSDALKTENTSENTSNSKDVNSTCYENAKSPLKLRAGVKSVTKVISRTDGSGSDSDVFDSTSNLSVDGKIVKEEKHEKQHESKFSDDKSQTVITERECVVENQVSVPNMEFTHAELDALKTEHAKMMETLKKASEERQARKEALKARLSRISTHDHSADLETRVSDVSYYHTQNMANKKENMEKSLRSDIPANRLDIVSVELNVDDKVSRNENEDENVNFDEIFEENLKYCSTHKVSDNLSDIVVNSDDDNVESELKPSEKHRPRNIKTLEVTLDLSAKTKLDNRQIPNTQHQSQNVEPQNENRKKYFNRKVLEDEIIPVCSNRQSQSYFKSFNLEECSRDKKATNSGSPTVPDVTSSALSSTGQYLAKSANYTDKMKSVTQSSTKNTDSTQHKDDILGLQTTKMHLNSPNLMTVGKENLLTAVYEPELKPTTSSVVDASNHRYDSTSFSSDVTYKPEKGGKVSTGTEVHIDSSDDFTQTEIDSLKLDLTGLDRDSDRILHNGDGIVKDEKTVKQELGKLKKERIEIIELLSMNYLPASLTVELLEAKLNYCIGQTDMLLKTLEDKCDLEIILDADFNHSLHQNETTREYVANYRSDLYKSQQEIELCKQKMERKLGRGRGRKIARNKDVLKWRRNAEIEAFRVERMIEQRNYEHSRSLSPLKSANTSHNDSMERLSRSVSPSSTDSSPRHMTPMEHKNYLVGLRKKLIEETEHDEFVHRISRSCSPQSLYSENEFSSPRCRSYSPSHSVWSPEHQQRSPYGSNTVLAPHSDSYSLARSYSHSPIRNVGINKGDSYSSGIKSPFSYSQRLSLSPQRQLASSVAPRHPCSYERRPYESIDAHEETKELFQEMQAARLQNQQEISRAQETLGSLRQKKGSPTRSRSNSAASSKRSYSSYRDYAKDVVDSSRRSMHGSVTGSYELYDDDVRPDVISPNQSVMSDLDSLVVTDSYYSQTTPSSEKYSKTRPVKSSDIKYKLYQNKFPK